MACREAGMLVRPLVAGAIAVSPPLVIGDEEIAEIARAFTAGLDAVAAR
jgi:adenosylmethionine-8-amino-7-oxononanoate aminotransferase